MYNPLTESPLNLWQTLNTQNIPKLKVILIKAEGIKFWFATRAQHIIWAAKIHLTTESDQFSMENLAKKKKNPQNWGWYISETSLFGLNYSWQLEKAMAPHSSILAWKIPWAEEPGGLQSMGRWESDTTERLHFHFSLSLTGEGNGSPLQYSCLENPRDGGAWWATFCGVAQSRTRLKWLSSSSSAINV